MNIKNLISPIYNLIYPAALLTARDEQFDKIKFIHGTNSALLATISQTNYQMLATGDLLNRGIAPMSGELYLNGMNEFGVSQDSISGGTLEDVEVCWNRYALNRSNSFQPEELTPEKFEETFRELEKTRQTSDRWNPLILRLMRYKQWKPEEFNALCAQNQARVDALVTRTRPKLSYADYLLKALDYDVEEMKKGISDLEKRKEILEELGYEWNEDDSFMNVVWSEKWDFRTGWNTLPSSGNYLFNDFNRSHFHQILADIINIKLTGNLHKEVTCLKETWIPYDTIRPQLLLRKKPEDTNYKRLHFLFDPAHRPLTFKTLEQKESILKPFPVLLGSTNVSTENNHYEKIIPSGAMLGTDIDVMIVRPQDASEASRWLKAHFLAHRITLYSSEILAHAAAPPPVRQFITPKAFAEAHKTADTQVLPVYRTDYPNGGKRIWHGVLHSARTFLFTQVIGGLYAINGIFSKAQPENLLITAAAHDMAREGDGTDHWDEQSGARCKELLLKSGVGEEEAAMFEYAIAKKEEAETLEQKIVHDADCIEINRCLKNTDGFESERLWMKTEFTESFFKEFIEESKRFIKLTEIKEIKDAIESSADPIACLYQILFYCHEKHGEFGDLWMSAAAHQDRFAGFEIEQRIKDRIEKFL